MAATASEAIMIELQKEGWEWIKSDLYYKKQKAKEKERENNNPMKTCVLKFDHFENIHRLPKEIPAIEGSPNFRQVPGFLVFGTGQPTKSGFKASLETICNKSGAKKVLWTNMRQEPVVYMNGQSFTPRLPDRMNENMEFPSMSGEDIEWLQDEFVSAVFKRIEESKENRFIPKEERGKVKYFRDTYAEHPDDRENIEYSVFLDNDESLVTLSGMYGQLQQLGFNLTYARLPIVDEKAPSEKDFDEILEILRQEGPDTACVFNCQMGKGRTTTGMILACLIKDILFGDQSKIYFKEEDIVKPQDFPDEDEAAEERGRRGQFTIIFNLFKLIPDAKEGKAHLDHIIDLCGVPPKGTGLQNLRECILWTQEKFNFEPKKKKPFWKKMSINFIERYFYLICFATYAKSFAKRGFDKNFTLWMDERAELRRLIQNGMQTFNWD